MPQAMEWSFATPMISPRLPCINGVIAFNPPPSCCPSPTRETPSKRYCEPSSIQALEHNRGVGAAEPERIRQHAAELHVVAPLAQDRHVGESRIERLDMGAFAEEAVVHHEQAVDRLLRAGGAERMPRQRFGRRNRRALVPEHLADGLDLLEVADRRRG